MTLGSITQALENLAPLSWQEEYDNSGLQLGLFDDKGAPLGSDATVSGILLCLDVTEAVIDEAVEKGCNLIVSHHPLLFRPLKNVRGEAFPQRCVARALRRGVAVYSAHTHLDNAPGGVSWEMAGRIGLCEVRTLAPLEVEDGQGAGSASSAPAPGSGVRSRSGVPGSGVIGVLPQPRPLEDFVARLSDVFSAPALRYYAPSHSEGRQKLIRTVALCGGSGGELVRDAVTAHADCFVTGEIRYHDYFEAGDCALVALGHYESEQFTMDLLCRYLKETLPEIADRIFKTALNTNPLANG